MDIAYATNAERIYVIGPSQISQKIWVSRFPQDSKVARVGNSRAIINSLWSFFLTCNPRSFYNGGGGIQEKGHIVNWICVSPLYAFELIAGCLSGFPLFPWLGAISKIKNHK